MARRHNVWGAYPFVDLTTDGEGLPRCQEFQYVGSMYQCTTKAKVERDGHGYCGVHDPVRREEASRRRSEVAAAKYQEQAERNRPKYQVCGKCEGEGVIVNPATSVWTSDDIDEDPEGFEDMRRGVYDVTCPQCGGKRVVTRQDIEDYEERREDARMAAMENGDWDAIRSGGY